MPKTDLNAFKGYRAGSVLFEIVRFGTVSAIMQADAATRVVFRNRFRSAEIGELVVNHQP